MRTLRDAKLHKFDFVTELATVDAPHFFVGDVEGLLLCTLDLHARPALEL